MIYSKTIQFHINIFSQNSKGVLVKKLVVDFKGVYFWNIMCQRCVPFYYMHHTFQLMFYYMVHGRFLHVCWFCSCAQARPNCWHIPFWRSFSSNYYNMQHKGSLDFLDYEMWVTKYFDYPTLCLSHDNDTCNVE